MAGLRSTSGATASLLLNLEAMLTAVLAWVVFRENADRRMVLGMACIVAGGMALAWPGGGVQAQSSGGGVLLVSLACLCWAVDNNLTRKVSASDALFIAGTKGLVAGVFNTLLAVGLGAALPDTPTLLATLLVGLLGYGVSLVLFVLALRGLGTARTGAYFSTAPFMGAALALLVFAEPVSLAFWMAAALMALGVGLHLSERHAHDHRHEPLEHDHMHSHDAHHQHAHAFSWNSSAAHRHPHQHANMQHSHPHYPDIHHRHRH
jgi:drug/metabolite transporter (DMT)-like permease